MRVNVSGGVSFSGHPINVPTGLSVTFYTNSDTDSEAMSFSPKPGTTATSPFTDGSTSFAVAGTTGVTKTTIGTAGSFNMNVGNRTGELDITTAR